MAVILSRPQCVNRHQIITWNNTDHDRWHHAASLDGNELKPPHQSFRHICTKMYLHRAPHWSQLARIWMCNFHRSLKCLPSMIAWFDGFLEMMNSKVRLYAHYLICWSIRRFKNVVLSCWLNTYLRMLSTGHLASATTSRTNILVPHF